VLNWSVKLNIFFIIYHYLGKGSKLRGFRYNQCLTDRPFEEITCIFSSPEENGMWLNFCDNIILIPSRILHWNCSSVQSGEILCCSVMLNPHHATIGIPPIYIYPSRCISEVLKYKKFQFCSTGYWDMKFTSGWLLILRSRLFS